MVILSNNNAPMQVFINSEPELSLSVTSHINCIVALCLINGMCLYQVMMTLHILNDVANDAELTQKLKVIP